MFDKDEMQAARFKIYEKKIWPYHSPLYISMNDKVYVLRLFFLNINAKKVVKINLGCFRHLSDQVLAFHKRFHKDPDFNVFRYSTYTKKKPNIFAVILKWK